LKGYKNVDIYNADVRFHNFDTPAQVILSVLTLMFIPIEYRQQVVDKCYQALPEGGAFIVVEKILGETGNLNNLYVNEYLRMKEKNGYSQEQIDRKRHSLEGVLVPLTATWNKQLLTSAGFRYIDCFWRWMNFAGWIAIK
jgi:tRNA (cmo5U34)-methyltransferase